MREYIFYGAVRSRTLRELAENYICHQGGTLLFYCDDGTPNYDVGYPVRPSQDIADYPEATVAVLCSGVLDVQRRLRAKGFPNPVVVAPLLGYRFICDAYRPAKEMQQATKKWISDHERELRQLYCLEDAYTNLLLEESIAERRSFHWTTMEMALQLGGWEEYFSNRMFIGGGQMTFLDGGAWRGDTIKAWHRLYGDRIEKIYAAEPDRSFLPLLQDTAVALGMGGCVEIVHAGLYNRKGSLRFTKTDDMIQEDAMGDISVPASRIDDIAKSVKGDLYIKLDLEGSEIPALEGATQTIHKYRPYMAVCLYHRMDDILSVPQFISRIAPDYRFYLRGGFHTECYAVPSG